MLGELVCLAVVTWVFLWSLAPPPRLLGSYSRPGLWFWPKVLLFYLLVKLRRWRGSGGEEQTEEEGGSAGYGVKSRPTPELMECVQPLSEHPKAIDAVYFNAGSENGHYLVAATARRPKGVINGVLYVRIPCVGLLQLPKMPDTLLFGDGEHYAAEGLRITPLSPMAAWRIQYNGPMKLRGEPLSRRQVEVDVQWTSSQPYFDFDTDMDAWALARSIAREPWSKEYFQALKDAHQTHYEQMGRIEGTVVVDDHPYVLRLDSMRDHSYGHKREWKLMHRYGLHMFTTEDGLQGNVGVICQPITCSQLEMGYVCEGGKVIPVSSVDLPLWQHGENGHPPTDYAFFFVAGRKEYLVEVSVVEAPEFYIGWEWETRVVERMVTFRINGRKGWGIAEWNYRHHGGRPHIYSTHDPAWTADLVKDAEEDRLPVRSETDPRCVVHYPSLKIPLDSGIILLSDKSYKKLTECKKMRIQLGGEDHHAQQCDSIPALSYDPKRDGYHRPCYMEFIKPRTIKKSKSDQENNNETSLPQVQYKSNKINTNEKSRPQAHPMFLPENKNKLHSETNSTSEAQLPHVQEYDIKKLDSNAQSSFVQEKSHPQAQSQFLPENISKLCSETKYTSEAQLPRVQENDIKKLDSNDQSSFVQENIIEKLNFEAQLPSVEENNIEKLDSNVQFPFLKENSIEKIYSEAPSLFVKQNSFEKIDSESQFPFVEENSIEKIDSEAPYPFVEENSTEKIDSESPSPFVEENSIEKMDSESPSPFVEENNIEKMDSESRFPFVEENSIEKVDSEAPSSYVEENSIEKMDSESPSPFVEGNCIEKIDSEAQSICYRECDSEDLNLQSQTGYGQISHEQELGLQSHFTCDRKNAYEESNILSQSIWVQGDYEDSPPQLLSVWSQGDDHKESVPILQPILGQDDNDGTQSVPQAQSIANGYEESNNPIQTMWTQDNDYEEPHAQTQSIWVQDSDYEELNIQDQSVWSQDTDYEKSDTQTESIWGQNSDYEKSNIRNLSVWSQNEDYEESNIQATSLWDQDDDYEEIDVNAHLVVNQENYKEKSNSHIQPRYDPESSVKTPDPLIQSIDNRESKTDEPENESQAVCHQEDEVESDLEYQSLYACSKNSINLRDFQHSVYENADDIEEPIPQFQSVINRKSNTEVSPLQGQSSHDHETDSVESDTDSVSVCDEDSGTHSQLVFSSGNKNEKANMHHPFIPERVDDCEADTQVQSMRHTENDSEVSEFHFQCVCNAENDELDDRHQVRNDLKNRRKKSDIQYQFSFDHESDSDESESQLESKFELENKTNPKAQPQGNLESDSEESDSESQCEYDLESEEESDYISEAVCDPSANGETPTISPFQSVYDNSNSNSLVRFDSYQENDTEDSDVESEEEYDVEDSISVSNLPLPSACNLKSSSEKSGLPNQVTFEHERDRESSVQAHQEYESKELNSNSPSTFDQENNEDSDSKTQSEDDEDSDDESDDASQSIHDPKVRSEDSDPHTQSTSQKDDDTEETDPESLSTFECENDSDESDTSSSN